MGSGLRVGGGGGAAPVSRCQGLGQPHGGRHAFRARDVRVAGPSLRVLPEWAPQDAGTKCWALPGTLSAMNLPPPYVRQDLRLREAVTWEPPDRLASAPQITADGPVQRLRVRSQRATASNSFSCSQIRTTAHPALVSATSSSRSRCTFPCSFESQYHSFVRGLEP